MNQNNAAQPGLTEDERNAVYEAWLAAQAGEFRNYSALMEAIETALLSKLRAPVAGEATCTAGTQLTAEDVVWVVNDIAELGVKIGNQFFFLYKGCSLVYGTGQHDDGRPMQWRPVFKREFGECAHPINYDDPTKTGTVSQQDSDEWRPLPAALPAPQASPVMGGAVAAWMHEEDPGRVISARQKAQAERDGGAYASSLRPYTIPLSRYGTPPASAAPAAVAKDGNLFWYGDPAARRGFNGDLYLAPQVSNPDFADAYEGAREDLAIWKRRALEAERALRAERETSSRLVAALNAENGPTHMGEPSAKASQTVRDVAAKRGEGGSQ